MKNQVLFYCLIISCAKLSVQAQSECVEVKKIWDNDVHSAFTSLIEFNGEYYCSFREGETHIFDKNGNAEGKVRVIKSLDGEKWESIALLSLNGFDLRDPKLSITPTGKLMIIIGGSIYKNKKLVGLIPHVSFSEDGIHFTDPVPIKINDSAGNGNDWIWRVTWNNNIGYAAMYSFTSNEDTNFVSKNAANLCLLSTKDGINFDFVTKFEISDLPNEATLRFDSKGNMFLMVRREKGNKRGFWGKSSFPYTDWTWKEMDIRLGGPDFIHLNDSLIVMGTRSHYTSIPKTILLTGNGSEKFQEIYVLPSGGDTSYPGFIIEDGQLWVSYYSTHETPLASVYLAKFPLKFFTR